MKGTRELSAYLNSSRAKRKKRKGEGKEGKLHCEKRREDGGEEKEKK